MRSVKHIGIALVVFALLLAAAQAPTVSAQDEDVPWVHGMAMHGETKYGPDFENLEYANPDAPKGGEITLRAVGTFNSFNPYILEGDSFWTSFGGARRFIETLTDQTLDEPFSQYCLLCETMQVPEDRTWVAFRMRDEARWSDGTPVTADDVIFSYEIIQEKGHPFYQDYWGSIVEAIKVDDMTVRFNFDPEEKTNRELPLIAGQMPVFQKAWWEGKEFDVPTLDVPVSSGPYFIVDVQPGSSFTFEKNPDYWGSDIPLNKGSFNFDRIRVDYYRDETVALEAFKSGEYDWQYENNSKNWATGYDFPAVEEGLVTKENIPNERVNGMQGFFYNQRRAIFEDALVRQALVYAFDFEWSNKNLFYDQYTRTKSYWDNSSLAAPAGPPTGAMAAYLEEYAGELPEGVFEDNWTPPSTGGTEDGLRANIAEGIVLLEEAGWIINEETGLVENEAGEPLEFEILLSSPAWERITQPYIENLARMGVTASMNVVDSSQYQTLMEDFDFDMTVVNRGMSPSPGNEQRNYWTCESAETLGSQNYWGLCNPAIDELVENIVQATDRDDLEAATQAVDRALQWQFLCVPHWHIRSERIAYWNVLERPEISPIYGVDFNTWWYAQDSAEAVRAAQEEIPFVEPTEEPPPDEAMEEEETAAEEEEAAAAGEEEEAVAEEEEAAAEEEAAEEEGAGGLSTNTIALIAIIALVLVAAVLFFRRQP